MGFDKEAVDSGRHRSTGQDRRERAVAPGAGPSAAVAKGITLNRAETTDLKIELYENGKISTTITSPKADLYLTERIMRTKNTVQIERADMEATAQTCDFNQLTKKFLLRDNVKVILKNFDAKSQMPGASAPTGAPAQASSLPASSPAASANPAPLLMAPSSLSLTPAGTPSRNESGLLDTPCAYSSTNAAPSHSP